MDFQIEEIVETNFIFLKCPKCKGYNIDKSEECKYCGKKLIIVFKENQKINPK